MNVDELVSSHKWRTNFGSNFEGLAPLNFLVLMLNV